jgi:predicted peroxiredoxin
VEDIIELDGRIVVDKEAMEQRGIGESELIEGIEVMGRREIHELILENGEQIVAF